MARFVPEKWKAGQVSSLYIYLFDCLDAFPGSLAEKFLEEKRGIMPETAKRFGLGFDPRKKCIVFPYEKQGGGLHVFKIRPMSVKPPWYDPKGQGIIPYGLGTLNGQKRIFVCEGETDTLRLSQELGTEEAVIGIPGVQSIGCLEEIVLEGSSLYVCLDTDSAGRKATAKAIERYGARPVLLPSNVKDVCEYFQAGNARDDFLALVADADALAAEAKQETTAMIQAISLASAGTKAAYMAPVLKKLDCQPASYIKVVLPDLASLSPIDYSRARKRIAKDGGISVAAIDAEVIPFKPKNKTNGDGPGSDVMFDEDEPWPWPVSDGAALLDDLAATFSRYLALPDHGAATLSLWTIFSHALAAFSVSPILAILSPEKQCGKSTTIDVLRHLVPRPLPSGNITPSALFRAVEQWQPTLFIDEADTFLKNSEELRGIINCGHTKGMAFVVRTVGEGANLEPKKFSTWAAKVIAMIGRPPDTIEDRSIILWLRRKGPGETVERMRIDCMLEETSNSYRRAARWAADNLEELKNADPEMPDDLSSHRAADNWRPLVAIADLAGGTWPHLAREAATAISGSLGNDDSSARVMLLADIQRIFKEKNTDKLFSADLVRALVEMEDRPWPELRSGKPLSVTSLSRLLNPFKITPKTLRIEPERKKGYELEDFSETFSRYLPNTAFPNVTP